MIDQEVQNLYKEVILDHNSRPCNFHKLDDFTSCAEGYNPMCGDRIKIYIKLIDKKISAISFQGEGCAISKASASIMTLGVMGASIEDAEKMFTLMHNMLTGVSLSEEEYSILGKAIVLSGVSQFPTRIKCASLAWHAMHDALTIKE